MDGKRYFTQIERKKTWVTVLISAKIDFKTKAKVRDRGHYIMIKGTIQQEDITLVNIYAPNIGAPEYMTNLHIISHSRGF